MLELTLYYCYFVVMNNFLLQFGIVYASVVCLVPCHVSLELGMELYEKYSKLAQSSAEIMNFHSIRHYI